MKIKLKNINEAALEGIDFDFPFKNGDIIEAQIPTREMVNSFAEDGAATMIMLIMDGTLFIGEEDDPIMIPGHFYELVDEEVL